MSVLIHRPLTGRIRLQTPFKHDNRAWLQSIGVARPTWSKADSAWLVSRPHLRTLVAGAASRFGEAEVWTDHRSDEVCTTACQMAERDECICSCGGRHHGGGAPVEGWVDLGSVLIGDTVRERWTVTT